ncbi:MAG: hypothetical protein HY304_01525 [candidate division Zixibacteria bacterium]|nr:hypothetical protein [candidate division Zixibacteria bacterium]
MAEITPTNPSGVGILDRLMRIDRRVIFAFIFVALIFPLFFNISQQIPLSREVTMLNDALQKVPDGALVLYAFDYDPPSAPELQPMAVAALKVGLKKHFRMVMIGLWPMGPQQSNLAWKVATADPRFAGLKLTYGVDYVNLGFQSGNEAVIQKMGSDIPSTFPQDYAGTPVSQIPIMNGVRNLGNFDFMVNISAGYPGTREWVQFGVDRFGLKMIAGNTAVQTTEMSPYVGRQLLGLAGGMRGAAEFEQVSGNPGRALRYMVGQSVAHVIVIIFIIIGNVAYFSTRKRTQ